jgi:putative flippase GtrA
MTLTHAVPTRHSPGPERGPARKGLIGQLLSFGVVGVISTVAYYVIYVVLRLVMGAQLSNLLALLITQVWNTAANRRHTFGLQTRKGMVKHQASGMIAFVVGLGLSSGLLWLLHHYSDPARWAEVLVLLAANGIATLVRFITLRLVIGHDEKVAARA